MALRTIELFAGGGGLALGLERVGARAVCYVEREAHAAAVLAARMGDGALAPAPVWSDVTTFDGRPWRGVVDLVAGGFPCNDASKARGFGDGIDGERTGLWAEFARIVREVEPGLVFLENVPALLVRGFGRVAGDLADLGFDAEWGVVPASAAGAPHERERLFLLAAHPGRTRLEGGREAGAAWDRPRWPAAPDVPRVDDGVALGLERVRLLGNGVVPAQAAIAFVVLAARLGVARNATVR